MWILGGGETRRFRGVLRHRSRRERGDAWLTDKAHGKASTHRNGADVCVWLPKRVAPPSTPAYIECVGPFVLRGVRRAVLGCWLPEFEREVD